MQTVHVHVELRSQPALCQQYPSDQDKASSTKMPKKVRNAIEIPRLSKAPYEAVLSSHRKQQDDGSLDSTMRNHEGARELFVPLIGITDDEYLLVG